MEKERAIKLPSVKWLTGNNVKYSRNDYFGCYGTSPTEGCFKKPTMNYTVRVLVADKDAAVPENLEISYYIQYPLGTNPSRSESVTQLFPYKPGGEEPTRYSEEFVTDAEIWINEELKNSGIRVY